MFNSFLSVQIALALPKVSMWNSQPERCLVTSHTGGRLGISSHAPQPVNLAPPPLTFNPLYGESEVDQSQCTHLSARLLLFHPFHFILVVVDLFVTFQVLVCLLPPQWSPFHRHKRKWETSECQNIRKDKWGREKKGEENERCGLQLWGLMITNFKVTCFSQCHKRFYKQLASRWVNRSPPNFAWAWRAIRVVTSSRSHTLLKVMKDFTKLTVGVQTSRPITTKLCMSLEGLLSGNLFKVMFTSQGHKGFY